MGIDLRPVVHATRSAVEPVLQHLARERRAAFALTGVTLVLTRGWLWLQR